MLLSAKLCSAPFLSPSASRPFLFSCLFPRKSKGFGQTAVLQSTSMSEAGVQPLQGLLAAALQNEVSVQAPQIVSNEDGNGKYRVLCQTGDILPAGDTSESGYGVFTYDPTPNATTGQPTGWSSARVVWPANVYVDQIVAMSQDGVLTARGYVDTGDSTNNSEDVLLLVPVEFLKPEPAAATDSSQSQTAAEGGTSGVTVTNGLGPVNGVLRVAKLDNSFVQGATSSVAETATLLPEPASGSNPTDGPAWLVADPDRFYIQVDGPLANQMGSAPVQVTLSTVNTPDNQAYNEAGTLITLYPLTGAGGAKKFRSKPQILVSDAVDYNALQATIGPERQVHLIALGGTVQLDLRPAIQGARRWWSARCGWRRPSPCTSLISTGWLFR